MTVTNSTVGEKIYFTGLTDISLLAHVEDTQDFKSCLPDPSDLHNSEFFPAVFQLDDFCP